MHNRENKIHCINLNKFKHAIDEYLKTFICLIESKLKQTELIREKSLIVLDNFVLRAENNKITIYKRTNPKLIASTIIYTILISNKDMPKITMEEISNISGFSLSSISSCYKTYFKSHYQRLKFHFRSYHGFNRIRNIISLYFFRLLRKKEIDYQKLVFILKKNILKNNDLPLELSEKDVNILFEMISVYEDTYIKYFNDLAKIINQLIVSSILHKKIGAFIIIKYVADLLKEKKVNLLQTSKTFYRSVIDIYDYLKKKCPNSSLKGV